MSKDPAVLWYTSDFLTGTLFFSDEQLGKYARLLCMQHQQGHLSEEDMLKICKTYDKKIFEKFKKDKGGLFYNERMETEIIKRQKYSESRKKNRESKKDMSNISKTYVKHMENENINENINRNGDRFKEEEVIQFWKDAGYEEAGKKYFNHYAGFNWVVNGREITDYQRHSKGIMLSKSKLLWLLNLEDNGNNRKKEQPETIEHRS